MAKSRCISVYFHVIHVKSLLGVALIHGFCVLRWMPKPKESQGAPSQRDHRLSTFRNCNQRSDIADIHWFFCFVILWNFLSHMKMKTMSSSSFSYLPSMFQGPNKMSSQGHQDPRISRCSCGPWDCLGYVRVLFQRSLRKLRSPCLCHVQHLPCFFLKARKSLRSLQFEVGRIEEISDCKVDLEIFSLK